MVPELIVERSIRMGVNLLGITDHNSGENAGAVVSAAANTSVAVLPGMEVESREGVHVLTLFDTVQALEDWQRVVYEALPRLDNDERVFGAQLVVDAKGNLLSVNKRLLMAAVDITLEEIADRVRAGGGACVPAHVDRPAYGLLGVLGLVPEGLDAAALEISPALPMDQARTRYPQLDGWTLLKSSDAHTLDDIGRSPTSFLVAEPTVEEIEWAFRGEHGRMVIQ